MQMSDLHINPGANNVPHQTQSLACAISAATQLHEPGKGLSQFPRTNLISDKVLSQTRLLPSQSEAVRDSIGAAATLSQLNQQHAGNFAPIKVSRLNIPGSVDNKLQSISSLRFQQPSNQLNHNQDHLKIGMVSSATFTSMALSNNSSMGQVTNVPSSNKFNESKKPRTHQNETANLQHIFRRDAQQLQQAQQLLQQQQQQQQVQSQQIQQFQHQQQPQMLIRNVNQNSIYASLDKNNKNHLASLQLQPNRVQHHQQPPQNQQQISQNQQQLLTASSLDSIILQQQQQQQQQEERQRRMLLQKQQQEQQQLLNRLQQQQQQQQFQIQQQQQSQPHQHQLQQQSQTQQLSQQLQQQLQQQQHSQHLQPQQSMQHLHLQPRQQIDQANQLNHQKSQQMKNQKLLKQITKFDYDAQRDASSSVGSVPTASQRTSLFSFPPSIDSALNPGITQDSQRNSGGIGTSYPNRSLLKHPTWANPILQTASHTSSSNTAPRLLPQSIRLSNYDAPSVTGPVSNSSLVSPLTSLPAPVKLERIEYDNPPPAATLRTSSSPPTCVNTTLISTITNSTTSSVDKPTSPANSDMEGKSMVMDEVSTGDITTGTSRSVFNLRYQNMNNLPKYSKAHKHNLHKRMTRRYGCCVDPVESLRLVRLALQRYINKDVNDLLQRYRETYFEKAITNIRNNCGSESISEDHVSSLFRDILDDVKQQFASPTNTPNTTPYPSSPPSRSVTPSRSGQAAGSDTASECGSQISDLPSSHLNSVLSRKRRTTSPFSAYKRSVPQSYDSDGDASLNYTGTNAGGKIRKRRRKGMRGVGATGRGGQRNGDGSRMPARNHLSPSRQTTSIDISKLTSETNFVLGSNANVWLGLGQARGRIYSKHTNLFRYNCETKDEKQWLIDAGHMTSHGVKAKLMLCDEVLELGRSPEYQFLARPEAELARFQLPDWFLSNMEANILLEQHQRLQQQTTRGRRRRRARGGTVSSGRRGPGSVSGDSNVGYLPDSILDRVVMPRLSSPPSRPASTPIDSVDMGSHSESEDLAPSPIAEDDSMDGGPVSTRTFDDEDEEDEDEDEDDLGVVRPGLESPFGLSGRFNPTTTRTSPGPPLLDRFDESPLPDPPLTAGFDIPS